ncbi:fumarylacetoacetate hydrolase family protein [Caulobacter sp.]|uniref:fumarylacetoacetate hydrolase family protein n=1 Tax=Caulobacter sp. TaxID=78 RepID=UPI0031E2B685
MRRARIAWNGGVHEAVVSADAQSLRLADRREVAAEAVTWLPPVEPKTIFALGLNYADHAAELAFKPPTEPLVFLKGPNALIGHNATTRRPADANQMHYECELAVVIGRGGRSIRAEDAYDHVAGYTVANDYAIREYLENYYRPNLRVKNRDGCTPIGPWMVDRDDVADPMNLALRTLVNGVEVQHGNTADMIFGIPQLIAFLSGFMTLNPGDLILTGTPHGVVYLQPGDTVTTDIEGVGALTNTLVAEDQKNP